MTSAIGSRTARSSGTSYVPPNVRRERGHALRKLVPRAAHADWAPPVERRDPVEILRGQDAQRIASLVPIRHDRMRASPFAFFRGAAAVMAEDLAATPTSGLRVQACGDAHLLNFGIYATPERELVFDVNDFDETLPAPFEWDVKRLATSVVVAGREQGFSSKQCESAARACAASYQNRIIASAAKGHLAVWYERIAADDLLTLIRTASERKLGASVMRKAERATSLGALGKLTQVVDGRLQISDDPPLVEHAAEMSDRVRALDAVRRYRRSLSDDVRALLGRYRAIDWARKVVGVGSVGTDDAIVLLLGDGLEDPLFLQVKEAHASVLEPHAGASRYANHGRRVVTGQRLTQQASDIFLGWTAIAERHYYVRQLRDMKASVPLEKLAADELGDYAQACAAALADGHARTGDPVTIAAYLGAGPAFARAIGQFADAYADQSERDYREFVAATASG
jgi:uncharacterized protein (DUF2252 family)